MKAIVLSGGKGTRLQSVVNDLPKPLAPVRGEPFLYILLRFLAAHGIDEVIISVQHLAEKFEERIVEFRKISKNVSIVKEPGPLGTGGAARFVSKNFSSSEQVLVLNGDTFFDFDLRGFISRNKNRNALALKSGADASRYGTVETSEGWVKRFAEKSPGVGNIYAGYSLLNISDLLALLPEGPSSLEHDFFPALITSGRETKAEVFDGRFIDIGVPEDYRFANEEFDFSRFAKGSSASC